MGNEKDKGSDWHSKSDHCFKGVVFTLTIQEGLTATEFEAQFSIEPTPNQEQAFIDVENDWSR